MNETIPAMSVGTAFSEMGLSDDLMRAIADLGYTVPTPIQAQTIPILLQGRDVLGQAPTGTGKTAAFGIPIMEQIAPEQRRPQALILTPTRELCMQVADMLTALGKYRGITFTPIYGGQPIERQFRALRQGVQVVVGTPGRVLDHLRQGTLDLTHVQMVVLDEADEMLDMGFIEDVEAILDQVTGAPRVSLFSATLPPQIAQLAAKYLHAPARVSVAKPRTVPTPIAQIIYEMREFAKVDALCRILDLEEPSSAIIFTRTKHMADELAEELLSRGYDAQVIHGDLSQAQRDRAMGRFRRGQTQLLIATDVAARGLDIPEVSHIINYDLPDEPDAYIHRIGRTGRAGRGGMAISLITPRDRRHLAFIERVVGRRLKAARVPTPADIAARRRDNFKRHVLETVAAGELESYRELVAELSEQHDATELAAAAFKLVAQATGKGEDRYGVIEEVPPMNRRRAFRGDSAAMARLFLHVGQRDGARPGDLVGAIANEAGVPGNAVGAIDMHDSFSFVDVPEEAAERVIRALNRTLIRGRRPDAELARPR
jgi:ATP-dependent RNA helicase DeaD